MINPEDYNKVIWNLAQNMPLGNSEKFLTKVRDRKTQERVMKLLNKRDVIRRESNTLFYRKNDIPKEIFKYKQRLLDEKAFRNDRALSEFGIY